MNDTVLFLDVDGVLNAFPSHRGKIPEGYLKGKASPYEISSGPYADNTYYNITYNPEIIAELLELHTSGQLKIIWLTTWGRGANISLSELLGFPGFDVLADPTDYPYNTMHGTNWWKSYALRNYLEEHNPSKVIWLEDEINQRRNHIQDILDRPEVLAISTRETTGITKRNLKKIREFLASDVHSTVDSVK